MGNDYDKLKKQMLAKAKQNRVNKVVSTNKYFKTKTSKSQKDFIAGDFSSSASKKAYGYKKYGLPEQSHITGGRSASNYKKLQNGEDPYEGKYIYDGKKHKVTNDDGSTFTSRKRFLTDDEKKAVETTGSTNVSDYKKNYKYAILRGVDSDGKNFDSQFNLRNKDGSIKWDGMNVAKNKVAKGGSKLNYVGGFLKDTVVDAGMDFLKKFDRYESGAMGAGLGIAESTQDIVDSITSGDFSFKNVDLGRAKKNWNESIEESNKTGFGHSAGHYLKEMSSRNDEQRYNAILKSSGQEKADKYRETEKKMQGVDNVFNTVAGLGLDFANPVHVGSAFSKTLKYAGKNTLKAGKAMLNGTGDIATGFKVDPLKTQEVIEKYASRFTKPGKIKKGDSAVDVLTDQNAIKTNKRGSMLDQEYGRVMNKAEQVKDVVKSNPNTQNLGHFLDEIGGTTESIAKNSDEELYFKTISRFSDNIDEIIKDVDDMPVEKADRFYDWIEKNNPELFNKLSDDITPVIDGHVEKLRSSKYYDDLIEQNLSKPKEDLGLSFNSTIESNKELAKNYDELNKARLLADKIEIPKRANYTELKDNFIKFGNDTKEQLSKGDYTFVNKLQNTMKDIDLKKLANDDNYKMEIIEKLNKELFGDGMIKSNIDKGNLTSFVEHLDDVLNYNLTKQSGAYSFKPKGTYRGTKKGTHHMFDRNGNANEINLNTSFHAPSLLDENYRDKMSFVDKLVGIKSKKELTEPIKTFEESMKKHGFASLTGKEKALYNSMMKEHGYATQALEQKMIKNGYSKLSAKKQKEYNSLINRLEIRDKAYAKVSNMNGEELLTHQGKFGQGDGNIYNYDLNDKFEKGFGGTRDNFVDQVQNEKNIKTQTADKSYQGGDLITGELKEYEQAEKLLKEDLKYSESVATANKFKAEQVEKLAKEIGIELPSTKKVVVKLSKNQTITSLPPVQKSFESLKKIVQKEVVEMVKSPATYKTKAKHYAELKKSFVNSLRTYGVPDNAYFKKLTNLKETLYEVEKNARKGVKETPLDKVVKSSEGGSGTPKNGMKMNLQLLAKKIDDMFDEFSGKSMDELGEAPKGKLNTFLKSIEDKFKDSNLSGNSLEKILDSKKKKYLSKTGISDANNPLYKDFKVKDGQLPSKSAKRLENGNVVDLESGQVKYSKSNKGDLKEIIKDNKYHYKNKEEDKLIEKLLSNPDAKPEHFMAVFDKMNIRYDVTDDKSLQKAFKQFENIVNKKVEKGSLNLGISSSKRSYNADNLKEFEKSPLSVLSEKLAEAKKYKDDRSAKYFENLIHDRGTDEIIKNIENARTIADKQKLYERLMQQAEYAHDSNNKLNYYEGISDWLMKQDGLAVREKNAIIDYMKKEQLELAKKGIDPNIIENKTMRDAMRSNSYSTQINKDANKASNDNVLDKIVKETQSKPHEKILDKMSDNIIKESEYLEKPYLDKTNSDKEYLELVDKLINNGNRLEKQKLYERLMQQSEYAYNNDKGLNYYEEMSDWLMKENGLDVREKNAIIDYMKKQQAKLASKGIDPNVVENKTMRDAMRKQQYSHEVNRNFETAQASKSDLEKILEKEKNRKPNQKLIDKIKQSDGIVKEPKPKKRIRVKEAEEQVTKNLELDEKIDKQIAEYLGRNTDDVTKKIKSTKNTPLDKIEPRNADDMLNNELTPKKVGETLDKDIATFERELSKENPPTFEKFKKFFTEKSANTEIGYEDGGLYKTYKSWLNSWKKGLTVYNPGWHAQNFFQNKGQNYLALGMDALGSQKNARNVLSHMNGVDKGAYDLISKNGRVYTKAELADLAKKHNIAEGMATNTTKSNGVFPWLEGKIDNSSVMKKALQSEQTARLHHFITQLERGMSSEDASKSVNKYLFDYASKSKADKMMSDFVDPFWSFHKSNAKLLTTAPFKHPSEVNNILRANRGLDDDVKDDERVPNSFREHQLPFGSFKDEDNGDNYNYFYDENMMPDVGKALPLESEDLDNKLNPLIRIALQQSKGQGNFGNKIVDKDKAGYDEVTKSERGGEIVRELNPVMNPLIKAYNDTKKHQKKTDEGKQTQSTTDIQKWMEWIAYITGNKGAYYRDTR